MTKYYLIVTVFLLIVITGCSSVSKPAPAPRISKADTALQGGETDLFKISDGVFDKYFKSGYGSLSKPEKVFVCVWSLEGEVNNGGFDQYYFNSAGNEALDVPDALITIGAHKTADIVKEANAVFGDKGPSPDRKSRQQQLDALSDKAQATLETLDKRFFKDPDGLEFLLKKYVEKNFGSFSR